jgi:Flp pilus assembly protein TadG
MATRHSERGTVLVVVPALTLVMFSLTAIALDLTLVHSAHRSIQQVASSAAEDAAGVIDERQLQQLGALAIDAERAREVATARIRSASLPGTLIAVRVDPTDTTVDVTLRVRVQHIVLGAFGRGDRSTTLRVSGRGRLHR